MHKALTDAGATAEIHTVSFAGHGGWSDRDMTRAQAVVFKFLDSHLKGVEVTVVSVRDASGTNRRTSLLRDANDSRSGFRLSAIACLLIPVVVALVIFAHGCHTGDHDDEPVVCPTGSRYGVAAMTRGILIAMSLVIGGWLGSLPSDVRGCAPAPRSGETVDIVDETALIVWDEANDVEHFIRRATFVGTASDFGFLVPTPNRPKVEPADADIFQELARLTEPKTEHRTVTSLSFGCSSGPVTGAAIETDRAESGLVVLEQKQVGNLDAAVLAFRADKTRKVEDTADELLNWLSSRGYAVRPDLTEWLTPYIDRNWMITAFKIAGQSSVASPSPGTHLSVKASAVRLTFKTDRPFFPYREPACAARRAIPKHPPRTPSLHRC